MVTEKQIIDDFAHQMLLKIEMRHNRYVPLGWMTMDKKRILELLKGEIREYEEINSQDEAIDIANYALFLWYLT